MPGWQRFGIGDIENCPQPVLLQHLYQSIGVDYGASRRIHQ